MGKQKRPKLAKKYIVRNVVILLLSAVFLVAGAGCLYVDGLLKNIGFTGHITPIVSQDINAGTVDSGTQYTTDGANQVNGLLKDEAITNILLIGVDDYDPNDPIGRSDSMMLISVDNRHKKLKMTSYMRDTYVAIPGHTSQKLNAAYHFGAYYAVEDDGAKPGDMQSVDAGAQLCMRTLELHFGMDIDRYVVVKDSAFNQVIDAFGGVDLQITAKEARQIDLSVGEDVSNLESTQTADVTTQHLNGVQAHYFSRIRQEGTQNGVDITIPNVNGHYGDMGRAERQRMVVQAVVDKFKSSDLGTISSVAKQVLPKVITNMNTDEVTSLLLQSMSILEYPTQSNQVPAENDYTAEVVYIGQQKADILEVNDLAQTREKALQFIYEDDRPQTTGDITQKMEALGQTEKPSGAGQDADPSADTGEGAGTDAGGTGW